jgi:hypothetical protein
MNQLALLPRRTFTVDSIWTFVTINAVLPVLTSIRRLKRSTNLFFAVESQRRELDFGENVIVRILAIGLGTFHRIEVKHVASPWREIFNRKPYTLISV